VPENANKKLSMALRNGEKAKKRTNFADHIQSKSTSSSKGKLYILKES
jgi:hypothetical protein